MEDKKEEIKRCGRELFSSKGFKDTNIAEIMKMAGMATGTFYNYYASKDKLFMELHLEENAKLKENIMAAVDLDGDPMEIMKQLISLNNEGMTSNPILKEWYNRDVFSKLEQSFSEENGMDSVKFLYDGFIQVVKKWQSENKMRNDIDAEMIMAIFSAIINIDLHKEEIGLDYFPKVQEYLGEFTMKGLMNHNKN